MSHPLPMFLQHLVIYHCNKYHNTFRKAHIQDEQTRINYIIKPLRLDSVHYCYLTFGKNWLHYDSLNTCRNFSIWLHLSKISCTACPLRFRCSHQIQISFMALMIHLENLRFSPQLSAFLREGTHHDICNHTIL